jgi:hypothetical protein
MSKITLDSVLDSISELYPMPDETPAIEINKLVVEVYKAQLIAEALSKVSSKIESLETTIELNA